MTHSNKTTPKNSELHDLGADRHRAEQRHPFLEEKEEDERHDDDGGDPAEADRPLDQPFAHPLPAHGGLAALPHRDEVDLPNDGLPRRR